VNIEARFAVQSRCWSGFGAVRSGEFMDSPTPGR
jgi:hypothetical protein